MDDILLYANYNLNLVKASKELSDESKASSNKGAISINKIQCLQDYIQYELNFEKECTDFCDLINSQMSQSCESITKKIGSFTKNNEIEFKFDESKTKDTTPDIGTIEKEKKKQIENFTNDLFEMNDTYTEASEVQLMMNCLQDYLSAVNNEFIEQEKYKITNKKELYKSQKLRALSLLYEMQDFCAGFMGFKFD